jgi:RHS repeat-associated protein
MRGLTPESRGRRTHVDAPNTFDPAGPPGNTNLTNITVTTYNANNTISSVTGAQTYPVSYTYDYALRMKTMTTTSASGNIITAWNYSTTTGELLSKRYNSNAAGSTGTGPSYTYTSAGRLKTRTWARGNHTRYDYDSAGRLSAKRYFTTAIADTGSNVGNDPNTGDVTYTSNALAQYTEAIAACNTSLARPGVYVGTAYDPTSLTTARSDLSLDPDLVSVASTGAQPLTIQRTLHRKYDALNRDTGFQLRLDLAPTSPLEAETTYRYSATNGRFAAISSNPIGASSTDTHDFLYDYEANSNLVKTTQSFTNYNFSTNTGTAIHQATRTYFTDRDALDVISHTNSSTNAVISASDYALNAIGQRTNIARSGTAPLGSASAAYVYNNRGELITADEATNTADRAYEYDAIGNRTKTASGTLTLPATNNWTSNALNQYTAIPSLPATPVHDADGNATSYPLPIDPTNNATLTFDGENRLIKVVTATSTVEYIYDALSRRVLSKSGTQCTYYIYDGWNCVAEYTGAVHTTGTAPALTRTYTHTWGLDLSQSLQGAGGVGGLLSSTKMPASGSPLTYYPLYDGNGNITAYINNICTVEASFDYDPFGNITNSNNAPALPYAFSTKPRDASTGLYYYGYRWYDPLTGRWPSRDPIEERGGLNLYGFVGNDGSNFIDIFGFIKIPGIYKNPESVEDDAQKLAILAKVRNLVQNGYWTSRDEAGKFGATSAAFLAYYGPRGFADVRDKANSKRIVLEYGGRICCRCNSTFNKDVLEYTLTGPFTTGGTRSLQISLYELCPEGTVEVGSYHSHPNPNGPSNYPGDRQQERSTTNLMAALYKQNRHMKCIQENYPSKGYIGELKGDSDSYRLTTHNHLMNSTNSGDFATLPKPDKL